MVSQIFQSVKKHFLFKVIVALCIMGCFCLISYYNSSLTATGSITLNYTWASSGQHINHTRFNVNEIKNERVLTEALERSGLADKMTYKELASCLSIEPSTTRAPQEKYIATEYRLSLVLEKKMKVTAVTLLDNILEAYVDLTYGDYIGNYAMIDFEQENLAERNYHEISIILDTQAQMFKEYMTTRRELDNEFVSETTGETFASVVNRFGNFSSITLEKFNAYIVNNGLSKDKNLPEKLSFENVLLQNDYERYAAQYDQRINGINRYDTDLSAIVMIPTLDAEDEFYMSKTKIGIDYMSEKSDYFLGERGDTSRKINYNKQWLANIQKKNATPEMYAKADQMVLDMIDELAEIEKTALATDDDYIQQVLSKSLLYTVFNKSDSMKFQLKKGSLIGVAVWGIITLIQFVYIVKKKKERDIYEKDFNL